MIEGGMQIVCYTFQVKEEKIRSIRDQINAAKGIREKTKYAQEMERELDVLMGCAEYDETMMNCRSCHHITNLRREAAGVIIKDRRLKRNNK